MELQSSSISPTVCIIDYTVGNIFSIEQACKKVGFNVIVSSDINSIKNSDCVILPGVGAFSTAMERLKKLDMISTLKEVVQSGKLMIGICLGMQLLFEKAMNLENIQVWG